MTTPAPAAASRRTVALPRPPVPPVTNALFPSSRTKPSTSEMTFLICEDNVSVSAGASEVAADDRRRHVVARGLGEHLVEWRAEQAQVCNHPGLYLARWSAGRPRLGQEQAERTAGAYPFRRADDDPSCSAPTRSSGDGGPRVRPTVRRVGACGHGDAGGEQRATAVEQVVVGRVGIDEGVVAT